MVEPASTFLMSSLAQPIQAPKSSVTVPTTATAVLAADDAAKIAWLRMIRYTPAVTMVAAWISAETGVGPSMASSSQDCSGTWADFPQAASRNSSPRIVMVVPEARSEAADTPANATVPNVANVSIVPSAMPMSPTRFTTKAFLAATAAEVLCCQKPISRYDARPTPSQPRNTTR